MRTQLLICSAIAAIALAGCTGGSDLPEPTLTPTAPAEVDDYDRLAAPTEMPDVTIFTFDEAAQYPDGMTIQINSVTTGEASDSMIGAEGTSGDIVTAQVELSNGGTRSVSLGRWAVHGYYGDANVGAVMISDSEGTVGDSFDGDLGSSQSVTANFAFAVPVDQTETIAISVDPRDDESDPVVFAGSAQ